MRVDEDVAADATYWNYWLLLGTVRIVLTRCVLGIGGSEGAQGKKWPSRMHAKSTGSVPLCAISLPLPARPASVCPPCACLSRTRLAHCLPVHVTLSSALASEPARRGQRQGLLHAPPEQTAVPRTCAHPAPEKVLQQQTKISAKDRVNQCVWAQAPNRNHHARTRMQAHAKRCRQQACIRPRQRSSSCLRMRVSSSIRPCHAQAREVHVFLQGHDHVFARAHETRAWERTWVLFFWLYFALEVDVKRDGAFDLSQLLGPALLQNLARNLPCMRASGCERVKGRESESTRLDGCSRATGSEHGRIVKRACVVGPT